MLHNIQLKNFKKHVDLGIAFSPEVNTLTGDNATGKSSVIKALLYALFGATAAGAKEHLWRWDSEGKKSVGLAMTVPEHGRVVITRTPNSAVVLSEDGRTLASGHTAVTRFIEETMGMVAKDLRTLCYSPQGETQSLLTMGPAVLQQKVESLAHLDTVDKVLGLISGDISRFSGRLEGIPDDINPALISDKLVNVENFLEYHRTELTSATRTEAYLKEELARATENVAQAQQTLHKRQYLESSKANLTKDIVAAKQEFEEIKARHMATEGDKLSADLERLEQQWLERSADKETLLAQCSADAEVIKTIELLEGEIKQFHKAVDKHKDAVVEVTWREAKLKQIACQSDRISDQLKEVQYLLKDKKSLLVGAICPTCHRPTAEVDIEKLTETIEKLSEKEAMLLAKLRQSKSEYSVLNSELAQWQLQLNYRAETLLEDRKTRLFTIKPVDQDTYFKNKTTLHLLINSLNHMKEEIDRRVKSLTLQSELGRQLDGCVRRLASLENKLISLDLELSALPIPSLDILLELKTSAAKEVSEIREYCLSLIKAIAQGEEELKTLKSEMVRTQELLKERSELTENKAEAEALQKYLRKNRTQFAVDIWDGLLNYASALVTHTSEGRLSELSRSIAGEFMVKEYDKVIPVTETSGAQKSIIGLAVRAAMAKTFYGKNLFLLLDEVSSDASETTAAAIAGMLQGLDVQIISVSHRTGESANAGVVFELK